MVQAHVGVGESLVFIERVLAWGLVLHNVMYPQVPCGEARKAEPLQERLGAVEHGEGGVLK